MNFIKKIKFLLKLSKEITFLESELVIWRANRHMTRVNMTELKKKISSYNQNKFWWIPKK